METRISTRAKWAKYAADLRDKALKLPAGPQRSELLRQSRQLTAAADMEKWMSSPGLRPPQDRSTNHE